MAYVQAVSPDLNTVGNVGWCLKFVEDAYNTPHLGATATDAWHATASPHPGENPPLEVQVPLWFSYIENGLDFGHVVINVPGRGLLSSPFKQDGTQVWFSSIAQCEATLNCHYLGWSEDLATIQLIEGEDMVDDAGARLILSSSMFLAQNGDTPDRQPTKEEVENLIGRTYADALTQVMSYQPWKNNYAKVKYYDADTQAKATKLKPGIYDTRV